MLELDIREELVCRRNSRGVEVNLKVVRSVGNVRMPRVRPASASSRNCGPSGLPSPAPPRPHAYRRGSAHMRRKHAGAAVVY